MKLATEFVRLPLRFDTDRLQEEIAAFDAADWRAHPSGFSGNSAIALISVGGTDNDEVGGPMLPTPHLRRCPYICQVLAHFGVVWSRSRLMRLAPGANVPEHSDINYHWFNRVRVHIPIVTLPSVTFRCGRASVHMGAGEAWIFDNWRQHSVENPTSQARIHLVADTAGTSRFWQLVARGQRQGFEGAATGGIVAYDRAATGKLITERFNVARVMPPAEIDLLVGDLRRDVSIASGEAADRRALSTLHFLLDSLCQEWRALWSVYGDEPAGWPEYARLIDHIREQTALIPQSIYMISNNVLARNVLNARVLNHALQLPEARGPSEREYLESEPRPPASRAESPVARATSEAATASRADAAPSEPVFERPVFIVAAPRSGGTLLFETLACSGHLWTVGGETHTLIESIPGLRPGAGGVDSNRLTAMHVTADVAAGIRAGLLAELRNRNGERPAPGRRVRLLEKTPKNALRIPFLRALFPDAQFVFLWRTPHENVSSIIEAWRSGGWITYPSLEGWDGPWSLLLPENWRQLRGRPLEEIAAHQWRSTNECILDDLAGLPAQDWLALSLAEFLAHPAAVAQRLCRFAGIEFDAALRTRTAGKLPLSRYTQTEPAPDKWRKNAAAVHRVLPLLEDTWTRLRTL